MKNLKILFITPTPVDDRSFGGAIRSHDLRTALRHVADVDTVVVQGGAEFRIDESWDEPKVKHLTYTARGASLDGLRQTARVRRCIGELLTEQHYDLIVARYLGQAIFVPGKAWSRLIVDPDDVYKTLGESNPTFRAKFKCWARNFVVALMLRRAQHVWIVNPKDEARLNLRRASLLSNVVAVPVQVRPRQPVVPGRILMVGFFPHPPNAQGLRWFASEVLPVLRDRFPDAELHAVGKCPPELSTGLGHGVVVRGFVDDIAAEYGRAALVIAPIIAGAGSQIKVIDALAHERPLVASKFAHEGFSDHLTAAEHLLIADGTAEWLVHCSAVLTDAPASEAMATRGYSVVRARYGLESMVAGVRATVAHTIKSDRKR